MSRVTMNVSDFTWKAGWDFVRFHLTFLEDGVPFVTEKGWKFNLSGGYVSPPSVQIYGTRRYVQVEIADDRKVALEKYLQGVPQLQELIAQTVSAREAGKPTRIEVGEGRVE